MRTALAVTLAVAVVAGTLTWVFNHNSPSACSPGDCAALATMVDDDIGAGTKAAGTSVSCKPPCLTQSGQVIPTGGDGDPWWLWSMWILIAAGVMSWGFRKEAAHIVARLRGSPPERADTIEAELREWAARALALARTRRRKAR
jgi:hypothetical protein